MPHRTATTERPAERATERPMVTRTRNGQALDLPLGTRMLLNIAGTKENLSSELVGLQHFEYLILKMPLVPGIRARLLNGEMVTLRYIAGGTIFGFKSQVLNHIVKPGFLLFVDYPDAMEQVDLRQHRRVNCLLPAAVHGRHGTYKCILLDLSEGGCKVSLELQRDDPFRETAVDDMLVLQCGFFGAEAPAQTTLSSLVKSISMDGNRMQLGLKFADLSTDTQLELSTYLENVACLI
uniref:Type IV pilus assembly PilZ n=1 Tax=Nitratidesulfovibrio vulgaris (strain DSM 19637 / Miyazaki F) TaxID=883 RepID=B8DIU6_NITV9